MFFGRNKNDEAAGPLPRELYLQIADDYAKYCSLSLEDGPEQKNREQMLLEGGSNAQKAVTEYLMACGRGQIAFGWWKHAADLTRLLRKIAPDDAENYLYELRNVSTNIWEYHTQVIQVADQELLEIKKTSPDYEPEFIRAEDASAELLLLYNSGKSTDERIRAAIDMLPSVEDWSDNDKAFYYYIIGDALKRRDANDERRLPFYAAQVYYQPGPGSLGWDELKKGLSGREEITPGFETARRLVKEYPLPDTLEELLDT